MEDHEAQDISIISGITAIVVVLVLALFSKSVHAAGLLKPVSGDQSQVFLQAHDVSVITNNEFAKTVVDQVFGNSCDHALDAVYSFPLTKQAAFLR